MRRVQGRSLRPVTAKPLEYGSKIAYFVRKSIYNASKEKAILYCPRSCASRLRYFLGLCPMPYQGRRPWTL
jgi:hypothetical protein